MEEEQPLIAEDFHIIGDYILLCGVFLNHTSESVEKENALCHLSYELHVVDS